MKNRKIGWKNEVKQKIFTIRISGLHLASGRVHETVLGHAYALCGVRKRAQMVMDFEADGMPSGHIILHSQVFGDFLPSYSMESTDHKEAIQCPERACM